MIPIDAEIRKEAIPQAPIPQPYGVIIKMIKISGYLRINRSLITISNLGPGSIPVSRRGSGGTHDNKQYPLGMLTHPPLHTPNPSAREHSHDLLLLQATSLMHNSCARSKLWKISIRGKTHIGCKTQLAANSGHPHWETSLK